MKIKTALLIIAISNSKLVAAQDQTIQVRAKDPDMVAAIQKAQDTLDDFLKLVATPPDGTSGFKLKVKISDSYGTEHMWVTPFRRTPSGFVGVLADEPEYR